MLVKKMVSDEIKLTQMFDDNVSREATNLVQESLRTPGNVIAPVIRANIQYVIMRKLQRKYHTDNT